MKLKMTASSDPKWLPAEKFFRDFVCSFQNVKRFFPFDPRSPGAVRQHLGYLDKRNQPDSEMLSQQLVRQNTDWGAAPEALRAAERLQQEDALVVLCQLRPQILGGPLSNLWKALTTLEHARRLRDICGRPVVPVCWVVADHNWGVMRKVLAVSADDELRRLKLDTEVKGCPSADRIRIHPAAFQILGRLAETMRITGQNNAAWCFLRQTAEDSSTLTEWFCRILVGLFSAYGLVVLDAISQRIRRAAVPLMQQFAVRQQTLHKELWAQAEQMIDLGYCPPFAAGESAALLFWDSERGRRRIFPARQGPQHAQPVPNLGNRNLNSVLEYDAGRFSPGEAVRPVVQDYLLPVAAAVVSADEAAIRAQTGELYRLFGMQMPPIFPRLCATSVSSEVQCEMKRWQIELSSLVCSGAIDEQKQRQLAELQKLCVDTIFEETEGEIAAAHEDLGQKLNSQIPSLEPVQKQNRLEIIRQLKYLQKKAHHHQRRKFNELVSGFRKVKNRLRPDGGPQEELALAPILMEMGLQWPDAILSRLHTEEQLWGHWWVFEDGEEHG